MPKKLVDESKINAGLKLLNVPTPVRPSIRDVALAVGVGRSTLHDRWTGKHGPRSTATGTQQLLSYQQEKALVRYIMLMDDWSFPPTYQMILDRALELARQNNPAIQKLGHHWLRRFLRRHEDLRGRLSKQLDRDRAKADNIKVLQDFFRKFKSIIERFNIRPEDIFNFDEKGVMYGQTGREWVITRKTRRVAYVSQDGSRKSVTIIECGRAGIPQELSETENNMPASLPLNGSAPHVLPPVFITSGQSYNESNFKYLFRTQFQNKPNILDGARFRKSENGYNEKEICLWYIQKHFDPLTACDEVDEDGKPLRHRLLIMDGHGSHLTTDIIRYCLQRNIHILCLPAHSTHRLQPLDVGIFGPLDKAYKKQISNWTRDSTDGGKINLASFFLCYHEAREIAITNHNMRSAFRATGLVPFNPRHVTAKIKQEISDKEKTLERLQFNSHTQILDPYNVPSTPANSRVLRDISKIKNDILQQDRLDWTKHNQTQSTRSRKEGSTIECGELAETREYIARLRERIHQLYTLLDATIRGAERAASEKDLQGFDLKRYRAKEMGADVPRVANVRQRLLAEELTTDEVLEIRERREREDQEEENRKIRVAAQREQNKIAKAEKAKQIQLRKEAKAAEKARVAAEKAMLQAGQQVGTHSSQHSHTPEASKRQNRRKPPKTPLKTIIAKQVQALLTPGSIVSLCNASFMQEVDSQTAITTPFHVQFKPSILNPPIHHTPTPALPKRSTQSKQTNLRYVRNEREEMDLEFPPIAPTGSQPLSSLVSTQNRNFPSTTAAVAFDIAETRSYNPNDAPEAITSLLSSLSLSNRSKRYPKRPQINPKPESGRGMIKGRNLTGITAVGGTKGGRNVSTRSRGRGCEKPEALGGVGEGGGVVASGSLSMVESPVSPSLYGSTSMT